MRFLLDMGASVATAMYLRNIGHDAVHLRDRGLQAIPDEEVIALANAEARVIVTFDLGFSRTLALTRNAGPSIVLFRLEKYSTSDINHRLALIVERHMEPLRSGAIVTVDPGRVRVRLLPIQ
jgi:predicted nuclease of predicted toxin-antitoxin system